MTIYTKLTRSAVFNIMMIQQCCMMEANPLLCSVCKQDFVSPLLPPCMHTVCQGCSDKPCGLCSKSHPETLPPDPLAEFIITSLVEQSDVCANCETIEQPMFFCETCQQPLCSTCRAITHQAKMFSKHRILRIEERSQSCCDVNCSLHGEPFILYSPNLRKPVCIECFNHIAPDDRNDLISLELGYKSCTSKVDIWASKLRLFMDEKREEAEVRNRLLLEHERSYETAKTQLFDLCQQITDTIVTTRDKMVEKLEEERNTLDKVYKEQLEKIEVIMAPIPLCLVSSQMLFASASKLDVLQLTSLLGDRIEQVTSQTVEKVSPGKTMNTMESRSELAKAIEPILGLSASWCPISAVCDVTAEGSGSIGSLSGYRGRRGSNSHGLPPILSKFQSVIDLSASFGQLYAKVEGPLKDIVGELANVTVQIQETQRDLTMRRCLIKSDNINQLVKQCQTLETRLSLHSNIIEELQPELQQLWQEQLDRVRRQQIIFREKADECNCMRNTARDILTAARQLSPFARCIENMSALIDPKRCHPPDPAPMESICLQISTIEPNSEGRIAAIQKEEQQRRAAQDAQKKVEELEREIVVKGLKPGKAKAKRKDLAKFMVNTTRERSPGGTDSALLSPFVRKMSPPTSFCDESFSDFSENEEYLNEFFMLTSNEEYHRTDANMDENAHCSSFLSINAVGLPNTCTSASSPCSPAESIKPSLSQRVTPDIGNSRMTMLQSLQDVFACQRDRDLLEERAFIQHNMSASAVKNAQVKGISQKEIEEATFRLMSPSRSIVETPEPPVKKERVRRRKKQRETSETESIIIEEQTTQTSEMPVQLAVDPPFMPVNLPVPQVPVVPVTVFEQTNDKIGTFEAKERVLQSLKEKVGQLAASSQMSDSGAE